MRVAMYHIYGGQEWVNFLLALGGDGINEKLIECYNKEIDRRTPGGAHGHEAHVGPRLSKRNVAKAQGRPLPPVRGVQHTESDSLLDLMPARPVVRRKLTQSGRARRAAGYAGSGCAFHCLAW